MNRFASGSDEVVCDVHVAESEAGADLSTEFTLQHPCPRQESSTSSAGPLRGAESSVLFPGKLRRTRVDTVGDLIEPTHNERRPL